MIPHCDTQTGVIYGCEPGSKIWWHEKGHLEYSKTALSGTLAVYQNIGFYFWMLAVTLSVINKFMLIFTIPLTLFYVGVELYEEYWCNQYAKKNFKGDDLNDGKEPQN